MNPQPNTAFWIEALGTLALQGTLVLAVAGLAQTWVTSPRWRRTAWLAALAGLALLLANALTGLDRKLAAALAPQGRPAPQFVVRGNLPPPPGAPLPGLGDSELRAVLTVDPAFPAASLEASPGIWWPAWVWLGGALLVGLWSALPRLWLAWAWRRRPPGQPAEAANRVAELSHRLGLRRRIRVLSSPRLAGPIAFGVLRPSVGLPADFWTANSRPEQDAMLAHELAHLAARDPFWLAVADTLVSLLWWHPLVWWGRRQFRAASEGAADEASLVVEDGPAVLAGCLVALASRWQRRGVLGLLGMAGFRSHLGRRVERLLGLRPGAQPLRPNAWRRLLLGAGSLVALAAAVALPWWMFPAHAGSGTTLLAALGEAVTRGAAPVTDLTGAPAALGDGGTGAAPSTATDPTNPTDPARQAVLTVQVPDVPGMEPKQVRTLSMDALTRRLAKLDRFSRVKCDPVGDDRIQVTLTLRAPGPDGDPVQAEPAAELWARVKRLVEHRGQLEFRPVHPESDELLARNECPDGYEVFSVAAATPGAPPRRSVVARESIKGLGSTNITESAVIRDTPDSQPRVALTFDEAGKHRFAEITLENVGRAIAVVLDGELLMAPRVNEPILGGKCEISGRFSEEEAGLLAASLAHPLPGPLKLVSNTMPTEAVPPADVVSIWVDTGERIRWNGREIAPGDALEEFKRAKARNADIVIRLVVVEGSRASVLMQLLDDCKTAGITRVSVSQVAERPPSTNGAPASPGSGLPPQPGQGGQTSVVQIPGATNAAAVLIQDARLLYELGKLDEAKVKLREALKLEPGNVLADHYLRQVVVRPSRRVEVEAPWQPAHPSPAQADPQLTRVTTPAALLRPLWQELERTWGADAVQQRPLELLRDHFAAAGADFGGTNTLPHQEAGLVAFQNAEGKALLLDRSTGALTVRTTRAEYQRIERLLDTAGWLVLEGKRLFETAQLDAAESNLVEAFKLDPDSGPARYYLRLVAEAKAAATPGVAADAGRQRPPTEPTPLLRPTDPRQAVGSATAPGAAIPTLASNAVPDSALSTRTFRVNPNLFVEGLTNLAAAAGIPTNLPPQESLRRLMSAAGLDFATTNAPAISPASSDPTAAASRSGKALFFNDRTGILLVRATLAELDTVEQLLQVLNSTPPQVTIEAKFVEVTMDDSQSLGFDWYLGGTTIPTNLVVRPAEAANSTNQGVWPGASGSGTVYSVTPEFQSYFGERGVAEVNRAAATLTGVMSDPQFKSVTQALQQAGTNGVRQLSGDQLDWPGRQATNAGNIRVTAALGGTLSGILTDPQLRVVLRALEQRSGVDVLSAPRVTTLSGRQAQIQVVNIQSIVTGLNPDALNAPGAGRTTNASPFTTAAIPAGPTLDIIPWVAADGYTIQLTVIPTVTEFLGYDEPPKDAKVRIWEGGKSRLVDPPLPRFRVRQMVTQAQVWDGQTLVLGGLVTEEVEKDRNGKPRKDGRSVRKQLLVFVTPTIVDPAGNRVHTADNLPYDPNRVPPQPRP